MPLQPPRLPRPVGGPPPLGSQPARGPLPPPEEAPAPPEEPAHVHLRGRRHHRPAQGAGRKFDAQSGTTTTVDCLPGSGAAVYPDKLRTELLGGKGPDVWRIWGGQIGAPFVKAKQALDLPYYQKYGWDSKINTAAIEGMTFDGVKSGVPFIALGIGGW